METKNFSHGVCLRQERPEDADFLLALYGTVREPELRMLPWSDEDKSAFVRMQFEAQTAHYKNAYYDAEYWVIEKDGSPIGRLYLHSRADDVRIVDIALLPEHRGSGTGREILEAIIAEASARGASVSIHVEMYNPARSLYQRLGFEEVTVQGVYILMVRKAGVPVR